MLPIKADVHSKVSREQLTARTSSMIDVDAWTGPGVRSALRRAGDRVLLTEIDGHTRTGLELAQRIDCLAGELTDRGLAGERIGLWYTNSIAAIEAFLAVEWIGGTRVPVDPEATADEARSTLKAAKVALVLADEMHSSLIDDEPNLVYTHGTYSNVAAGPVLPLSAVPRERTHTLFTRGVTEDGLQAVALSYRNWAATISMNTALYQNGRY
jgi:acyl-CoA synthetase (AMP-forming)/AMP-acid ligase II